VHEESGGLMPTPEEIAAAEAKAKTDADEAAALKAKENGNGNADDSKDLESKWDPETKKYIESLRSEAGKHRTDKKALNDRLEKLEKGLKATLGLEDNEPPEKKIESLKAQTEAQQFQTAVLEAAIENGIGKDQIDYFQFLIEKAASQLTDGDEITADSMMEIVGKVKKAGGASNSNGGNTSVDTTGKPNPDGAVDYGGLSLEQFARMSITEKSVMYTKNPDRYASMMKDAKQKRLII
jgi:hypothetical protein